MKTVMVRYKPSEKEASANEKLVHAVFDELRSLATEGIRYTCYRQADGVTFVHVATHDVPNPLTSLPSFRAFQAGLRERCVEQPVVTELFAVDSYAEAPVGREIAR